MRGLRAALVFLTRVPVGLGRRPASTGEALPWFGVVGVGIGAVAGGVYAGLAELVGPRTAAPLAVAAAVALTGALHLDGLGDVADGFGGGTTVQRRLEIMKDSRLGTYGVAAVVLALVIQVSALGSLTGAQGVAALVAAHGLGRAAALGLMLTRRPATSGGLGVDYLADLRAGPTALGALVAAAAAVAFCGPWGLVAVAAAVVGAVLTGAVAQRAIGGISGDVLGAAEQVVEVAVLVVCAGLATRLDGWPWWA